MSTHAITGAASGIGAATRQRLLDADHKVIGVDLHDADVVGDLSTPQGRAEASAATTELADGHLDGLVCCAGLGPLSEHPGGLLAAVNYFGTVDFVAGVRDALVTAPAASVVVLSSSSTSTQPGIPEDLVSLPNLPTRTGHGTKPSDRNGSAQEYASARSHPG
ncbi:SDR family NAD(P)-dependent oxidoreductase [Rhodococcus sp. NPDC058521]|uniref:SDR family NAD(P)-dependent oxidoreductase n=1 Tax=Rhodococcus sp. NPDC058521 TaxID=3346536 RepID=UPI00365D7D9C